MFMSIHTLQSDDSLIDFFQLDSKKAHFPVIVASSHKTKYGTLASTILAGVPITGCLGDQSAALVGQKGSLLVWPKGAHGTGCFLLYNVGKSVISTHGLLTSVAFDFGGDSKPKYALEGSIAVAGSSVKFMVNNFGFVESSSKLSGLAETVEDNGGVTFAPAFSGLFAPYWIDDARGTIFGITPYTQRGHIARATLEAICFQTRAILEAMEKDSKKALTEFAIQTNLIGIPAKQPAMRETTAGLAIGTWNTIDELKHVNTHGSTVFRPDIANEDGSKRFGRWTKALEMSKDWLGD